MMRVRRTREEQTPSKVEPANRKATECQQVQQGIPEKRGWRPLPEPR
jgi:hypothetical protein